MIGGGLPPGSRDMQGRAQDGRRGACRRCCRTRAPRSAARHRAAASDGCGRSRLHFAAARGARHLRRDSARASAWPSTSITCGGTRTSNAHIARAAQARASRTTSATGWCRPSDLLLDRGMMGDGVIDLRPASAAWSRRAGFHGASGGGDLLGAELVEASGRRVCAPAWSATIRCVDYSTCAFGRVHHSPGRVRALGLAQTWPSRPPPGLISEHSSRWRIMICTALMPIGSSGGIKRGIEPGGEHAGNLRRILRASRAPSQRASFSSARRLLLRARAPPCATSSTPSAMGATATKNAAIARRA